MRDLRGIWSSFITSFVVMESAKIPSPMARIALVLSTLGLKMLVFETIVQFVEIIV